MIDARWVHLGGLGTYTYNLITRLARHSDEFTLKAIINPRSVQRLEPFLKQLALSNASMYTLREQFEIPLLCRGFDLLHVPHYNAPLLYRGPLVVSILDLIHILDPVYRRKPGSWLYARPMLTLVARKAKHIITLSEYSKRTLVESLGISESKISVIYCGVDPQFSPMCREAASEVVSRALGIRCPFILYLGNLKPHKNVSILIGAMAELRKRRSVPHTLLIVGDDAHWGRARREECSRAGIADATQFVKGVSHELLPKIYAAADLLVMPSTLEGFGLPVLEAMACGTPVVSSNAASLPEVGGDAVLYFDPSSISELAAKIERLLDSPGLQQSLREKGRERAKYFDWNNSVCRHMQIYRQVLGAN